MGSALPVFTMLLVKSPKVVGEDSNGSAQDYSMALLFKTIGMFLGVPMMTAIWTTSITLGGAGLGLPYYASAVSLYRLSVSCI